jgi:hypothetical protein
MLFRIFGAVRESGCMSFGWREEGSAIMKGDLELRRPRPGSHTAAGRSTNDPPNYLTFYDVPRCSCLQYREHITICICVCVCVCVYTYIYVTSTKGLGFRLWWGSASVKSFRGMEQCNWLRDGFSHLPRFSHLPGFTLQPRLLRWRTSSMGWKHDMVGQHGKTSC